MQIVIEWSWFSFVVGFVSALVVGFWVIFAAAYKQWKKSRKMDDQINSWLSGGGAGSAKAE